MSFVKTELELTERFIKGLKNYSLTKEEIQGWYYVGGGHTQNTRMNALLNQIFFSHFPTSPVPELENECVCGHPIQLNAFISDGERILVLGSCCVQRFVTTGIKKTCRKCKRPYKGCYLECPTCRPVFGAQKVCKHCGTVIRRFCPTCLSKTNHNPDESSHQSNHKNTVHPNHTSDT